MGLDDPNNAADAAAGATTPAPAEPAASGQTEQPKMPDISDDPWAGFGEEKEPDKTEVEAKSDEPDGKEMKKTPRTKLSRKLSVRKSPRKRLMRKSRMRESRPKKTSTSRIRRR